MKPFKVLHTADLHLDCPMSALGDRAELRRHELIQTFQKIAELARVEQVDALVIAGDLFDSTNPTPATLRAVEQTLAQIAPIPVLLVRGNHDYAYGMQVPDNVHIFHDRIGKVSIGQADIYGVSFGGDECTSCNIEGLMAEDATRVQILVLHGELIGTGQSSRYNPITPAVLAQTGMDYVALGHIHRYDGVHQINNTAYAYSGMPEGRGFDETGEKGIILAEVTPNHVHARFVPLCRRKYTVLKVDVSDCADYHQVYEKIKSAGVCKEDLYKIILTGQTDQVFPVSLLIQLLENDCFFAKVSDHTTPAVDLKQLEREQSLKGLFVRELRKNGGSEKAYKYGLRALGGGRVEVDAD